MALTETNGSTSITGAGTETTLFDVSGLNHYACTIYLNPMTSSDTITINVYVYDSANTTMRVLYTDTKTGTQNTQVFIPFVPTSEYKVTLQSTAGSTHTFYWSRYNM